ncbi:MAG TPA: hypothetical protein VNI02_19540 [Blastocatellia bacterium]|jgi:hypothetical protein|nr:hypothetical protein [Blastocatellia bacterium]
MSARESELKRKHEQELKRLRKVENEAARQARLEKEAKEKEEKERVFKERQEKQRAEAEKTLRAEALQTWVANGGDEASFKKEWPSIRSEMLKRKVLEQDEERRRARLSSGRYNL